MSEQIKILAAAARERTFTVRQLAEAAGADAATVLTVLKHSAQAWFALEKNKSNSGAQTIFYAPTSTGREEIAAYLDEVTMAFARSLPGSGSCEFRSDTEISVGAADELMRRAKALFEGGTGLTSRTATWASQVGTQICH